MYRLLLMPLDAEITIRDRFNRVRPYFFRKDGANLGIFNSNIFTDSFDDIYAHLVLEEPFKIIPKIFLLKNDHHKDDVEKKISELPLSKILFKPFHPDDLMSCIRGFLNRL